MKNMIGGAFAGMLLLLGVMAVAEDRKPQPGGNAAVPAELTLEGEIIDLTSYLKDGTHGKDVWKMAKAHVKNGTPAALLTFDGKLFVVTPYNKDGFSPLQNVGEVVRVRGTVYERDGVKCIVAKETKKLPPDYKGEGEEGHK